MRRGFLVSADSRFAAQAASEMQEENRFAAQAASIVQEENRFAAQEASVMQEVYRFAAQAASELQKQKTLAGRRGSAVSSEPSQKTEKVFVDARVVSQLGMKGCRELAVLTHGGYAAFRSGKDVHVG